MQLVITTGRGLGELFGGWSYLMTSNTAVFHQMNPIEDFEFGLLINFQEMVKDKKFIFTFDSTKNARFGILPRYAKNELQIQWFELPNCFIFHNGESA